MQSAGLPDCWTAGTAGLMDCWTAGLLITSYTAVYLGSTCRFLQCLAKLHERDFAELWWIPGIQSHPNSTL